MSRVDVIVPCYNYGRFLRECVESVLTQPVDVRVLIIDDASTDDTPQVASALASEDSRVEFRRHVANRGHIATYNEGLEWVTGEYNLLLSADDLLVPGALARAMNLLDSEPSLGFVFGRDIYFQSSAPKPFPRTTSESCRCKIVKGLELIEESCTKGANLVPTPTAIIRTSLLSDVGFYRPELPHSADMAMWLKYAAFADVGSLDADQAYYRIHANNMSHNYFGRPLRDILQKKAAFEALFNDVGHRIPILEDLRNKAYRAISVEALNWACEAFENRDLEHCRRSLELAAICWPGAVSLKSYRRLKIKLALGPAICNLLRYFSCRPRRSH